MRLITDDYKKLNEELHARNKTYGMSGRHYLADVLKLCDAYKTSDVLDYGCGKSTLQINLPYTIKQYDPAIKKYSALPNSADIVVCTDVLEHIEPELIDNVLSHIASLTKKAAYLVAATTPAQKTLSDGRNAHLLVKPTQWWINKIYEHFHVKKMLDQDTQVIFLVEKKRSGVMN